MTVWRVKSGDLDQLAVIIPPPPQEAVLRNVSEGLQLHRALLRSVSPRLQNKDKVAALLADIKDLIIQINKVGERFEIASIHDSTRPPPPLFITRLSFCVALQMVKMANGEAAVQPSPSPSPVVLRLPGEYDVQVAAHLSLGQLQSFGRDVLRCLRSLDRSGEEEAES